MTELTDAQKADKFKNRRRLAWWSFVLLTVFGGGLILFGAYSSEGAENINAMSFLIGTVFGVWASIVLSYVGAATINQMNERRYDAQSGNLTHQRDSFETEVDDNR
jgi:uncharacterized membrane protein (DUF485 family)